MAAHEMHDDERRTLWRQYAEVHAQAQGTFDSSVRTLAAAGLAVTVSLATALKSLDGWGVAAVCTLLAALAANLLSFATAQLDMRRRLKFVKESDLRGRDKTGWTHGTAFLNVVAGTSLLAGGGLLAVFVASSL